MNRAEHQKNEDQHGQHDKTATGDNSDFCAVRQAAKKFLHVKYPFPEYHFVLYSIIVILF